MAEIKPTAGNEPKRVGRVPSHGGQKGIVVSADVFSFFDQV
jgi:hypothetical protein